MKELDLSHNNLDATGIRNICRKLNISYLTKINIGNNAIGEQAADDIGNFLSKNTELKELDLSHNNLDATGIRNIFRKLNISRLTKINISNNAIGEQAADDIGNFLSKNTELKELDLSHNNLDATGIRNICRKLNISHLTKINISNNAVGKQAADDIGNFLSKNTELKELDLSHNNLDATGIRNICRKLNISHLTKINISNNAIGEQAADDIGNVLSKNTELKELDISCNNLYESGIKMLCKRIANLSKLTKLKIDGNNITHLAADYVTEVLLYNVKLEEIDISDNSVLAAGVVSIFNGMKSVFTLRNVNISDNWITYKAADSIAAVLSQNTHLRKLYLRKNYLETNGVIVLCKAMSNILYLTHLDISCNKITHEAAHDITALLIHNPELKELDLSNNLMQTPGVTIVCKAIRTLTNLSKLNIGDNNITGGAARDLAIVLSKMKPLEEFSLNLEASRSSAVQIFLTMKSCIGLLKLNVGSTEITDLAACTCNIAAVLNGNIKMKELDLSHNNLDATGISTIFKKLNISHLIKINISNNVIGEQAADDIGNFLSKNTELKELDLSHNNLCAAGISNICRKLNISHLTKINISNNAVGEQAADDIGNFLSKNTELKELDLSHNNLDATGIRNICRKLNISHLTKINISNNAIGEQAADDIGNFLSKNTELKELDLSCNNLYESGIKMLCKRIANLSKLTKLKIDGNNITHLAADYVTEVLLYNVKLEEIDISDNSLLAAGVVSIFNGMKSVFTLRNVNISDNWITYKAADSIAAVLSQNTHLRKLCLRKNYLETNGIIVLCKAMSNILYLTHLDISCNKITHEAAHDITALLIHNPELKELDLSNNLMQTPGVTIVCKAIRTLTNLSKLNTGDNNITGGAAWDLAIVLSKMKPLEEFSLNLEASRSSAVQIFLTMKSCIGLLKLNVGSTEITDLAACTCNIAAVLNGNIKMKELDLSHNNLDATGISTIFKKLNISHLTKINISNNVIGEQAADDIGNFLSKNTELKELDLSHNNLCAAGISNICRKLNISHLTKINISNNAIGVQAADDIGNFLSKNTELKELDLSYNNLCTAGISNICRKLNISHLTKINISNNVIGVLAAGDIGNFLSKNTKLKELDLSYNNLYATGISNICRKLNISHLTLNKY